jgi:hypothetical protein
MRFPLLVAAWCLGGCYATGQVAPGALQDASGLTGPRLLAGSSVLLEPGTMVRARLKDGGHTAWMEASGLNVSSEGMRLSDSLSVSDVAEVKVNGLDPGELALLRETAPPGGEVGRTWRFSDQYQLKAPGPEAVAWARRFSARALAAGKTGGRWQLSRGENWFFHRPQELEARHLVEAGSPGAAFAPGFRWNQVEAIELRSLDPVQSAMTVPLFPVVMLGYWLFSDDMERASSPTGGEGEGTPPMLTWSEPAARPLFTAQAHRRSMVQALAAVDVQGTHGGDLASGLSVGLRCRNLYEFALVGRGLSLAGPGGSRAGLLAIGASMGLHVDGDGDPGFAFHLGLEVVGGSSRPSETVVQLKWGPRLGLGKSLFLTVAPINLSILSTPATATQPGWSVARIVSSLELGGTL